MYWNAHLTDLSYTGLWFKITRLHRLFLLETLPVAEKWPCPPQKPSRQSLFYVYLYRATGSYSTKHRWQKVWKTINLTVNKEKSTPENLNRVNIKFCWIYTRIYIYFFGEKRYLTQCRSMRGKGKWEYTALDESLEVTSTHFTVIKQRAFKQKFRQKYF